MQFWRVALASLLAALGAQSGFAYRAIPAPRVAAHQHLISPEFATIINQPVLDGAGLIKLMDDAGIARGVVLSMGYSYGDERKQIPEADRDRLTARENDWTSRQVVNSHGRLVGFCGVNPLRDAAIAEIERCLKLPGMIGVKLHFANSGVSLRIPAHVVRLQRVFALADARHAPIVVHMHARTGAPYGPKDARLFIDKLLSRAPNIVVQVAHLSGSGTFPPDAQAAMKVFAAAIARDDPRTRNLYFDQCVVATASTTPSDGARIAAAIRSVGVNRMFFGSDMPIGGNPPPKENWEVFTAKVPLTRNELRTIAQAIPPYLR
jgi:predicted TIM-barrel fold metal-dependent hydrolase